MVCSGMDKDKDRLKSPINVTTMIDYKTVGQNSKCCLCTCNLVTALFDWNKLSSGNTDYKPYLEGLKHFHFELKQVLILE